MGDIVKRGGRCFGQGERSSPMIQRPMSCEMSSRQRPLQNDSFELFATAPITVDPAIKRSETVRQFLLKYRSRSATDTLSP